jgi:hypothetical protein
MKKRISTLTLAVVWLFSLSVEAKTQNCPPLRSASEAYARAAAVFIGKVIGQGQIFAMTTQGSCLVTHVARFNVVKSYFGASDGPEFTIYNDYPGDDFKEGETYLVYVYEQEGLKGTRYAYREPQNPSPGFLTCSRTRPVSEAEKDLHALEEFTNGLTGVTIHGTVTRRGKAMPLGGVRVQVTGQGKRYDLITDDEGRYQVTGLSAGEYRVKIKLRWTLKAVNASRSLTVADRGSLDESFVVRPRFGW